MRSQSTAEVIAALLRETGQAHHQAFLATDGEDPEWPLWYAEYLQEKLSGLLDHAFTRSEIVYLLYHLDQRMGEERPQEAWPDYYARILVEYYEP